MNQAINKNTTFLKFECDFCGYDSSLDLRECPECGRLKRVLKTTARTVSQTTDAAFYGGAERLESATPYAIPSEHALTADFVFECEHCRYRSPRSLFECPECGRGEFVKIAAVFARENEAAAQRPRTIGRGKRNVFETLGFLLLSIAFEAFLGGFGVSVLSDAEPEFRRFLSGKLWFGALCLTIAGSAFYAYGRHLENKYRPRFRQTK